MDIEKIIEEIPNIKYYNISYRNYFGLTNGCIVMVYPFVTELFKIHKPIDNLTKGGLYHYIRTSYEKEFEEIFRGHEIDFCDGRFYFSPCVMYETVSGYKIHTEKESDNFGFPKEYYDQNSINFDKALKNHLRKEKLKKINTI